MNESDSGTRTDLLEAVRGQLQAGVLTCEHRPLTWFFEVTKRCNIRCLTCARLYDQRFSDAEFAGSMKPEVVESVADQLTDSIVVSPTGFGEPMLNAHLFDFIDSFKAHDPYVYLISNGTLLDGNVDRLVESGLDQIFVSMDGGTKEVFEHFRAGASWDQVAESLVKLNAAKQARGSKTPEVVIEFVAMRDNLHTLPKLVERAATEWGASRMTVDCLIFSPNPDEGYRLFYMEQNLSNLPFEEVSKLFSEAGELAREHGLILFGPYYERDQEAIWQSAKDQTLRAIWESARVRTLCSIGFPRPYQTVHGWVAFCGWAVHDDGIAKVTYQIGETAEGQAEYGIRRDDVSKSLGDTRMFPDKDACGFQIPINPSMLREGTNTLNIVIETCNGAQVPMDPVEFQYKPGPRVILDNLAAGQVVDERHCLIGWVAPPLPDALGIKLGDGVMEGVTFGLDRPDAAVTLRESGCELGDGQKIGFFLPLDLSEFPEGPIPVQIDAWCDGEHRGTDLQFEIELRRGSAREGRVADRAQGAIESPSGDSVLSGTLWFAGWAVYGQDTRAIELRLDEELLPSLVQMIPRPEVRDRLQGDGLSDRLGFAVPVDTTELPAGRRTFRLVAVTEGGTEEILSEVDLVIGTDGDLPRSRRPRPIHELPEPTASIPLPECESEATPAKETRLSPRVDSKDVPYCVLPWISAFVSFNGDLRPCCYAAPDQSLGNVLKRPFEEVWNGSEYKRLRKMMLAGQVPKMCSDCVANKRYRGPEELVRLATIGE